MECALLDGRSSFNRPSSCAMSDISSLYSFRPITAAAPPRYGDTNHMATREPQGAWNSATKPGCDGLGSTAGEFRPVSAPSLSGSARAKQRIEMLETELARARQERLAMEDHVSNLAHELA